MHLLFHQDPEIKSVNRSTNATETSRPNQPDFATRAAQSELGGAYARPELDGFRDRRPDELAILRAIHWSGARR